jgi:hypothetical protein
MCKEKNSPYFYIGYRYRNFVPSSDDLGTYYFTSNQYVSDNFNNFESYILAEFFNKNDAYEFETILIQETSSEYQINRFKYNQKSNQQPTRHFYKGTLKQSIMYQRFKRQFVGPKLTRRQAKSIRENLT